MIFLVKNNLIKGLEEGIRKIENFEIYSSTDVVVEGLRLLCNAFVYSSVLDEAIENCITVVQRLLKARPTSVMLSNSVRRILEKVNTLLKDGASLDELRGMVKEEYNSLVNNMNKALEAVALMGSKRIDDGDVILTNSYSRTVLTLLEKAWEKGIRFQVYVVESRPGSEGLFTASYLDNKGIPVTLFVDSAVRFFMKDVDKVFVGAEAIAANGAVVNKVGTSLIALAAHEARVRVFVVASTLKFSPETIFGELVKLMLRPIKRLPERIPVELSEVPAAEFPLFDVTPPEYIDAIITERGVVAPEAVILLVRDIYGWPPRLKKIADITSELKAMVQGGVK